MRLYFLRHADALDNANDAIRPLSPKGERQSRAVGGFLRDAGIAFDAAFSSPLVRARETAEIVLGLTGAVKPARLRAVDALLNGTSAREFEGWLRALQEVDHVLLVGHAPSLSERARVLLSIEDPGALDLPKCGLACVESEDGRQGALKFLVTPKQLGRRP